MSVLRVDHPFVLSLSKDGRAAKSAKVYSWFDKLTTNGKWIGRE